jgi:hypothetical protein
MEPGYIFFCIMVSNSAAKSVPLLLQLLTNQMKMIFAGFLQDLVYKLSKVGQAIENNDLSTASSVLGRNTDTDWVKKANIAFRKVTLNYCITKLQ